jgi:hypothetical protein
MTTVGNSRQRNSLVQAKPLFRADNMRKNIANGRQECTAWRSAMGIEVCPNAIKNSIKKREPQLPFL